MAKREVRYELQVKEGSEWCESSFSPYDETLSGCHDGLEEARVTSIENVRKMRIVRISTEVIYPKPKKARK